MRPISLFSILLLGIHSLVACETPTTTVDRCGDGFLDPGEECDGNTLPIQNCEELGYYSQSGPIVCTRECRLNLSVCASRCGDGVIQSQYGEDCEGNNLAGKDCLSLDRGAGQLSCTAECRFDVSSCENSSICGNGILESPFEQCDGTNLNDQDCESLGYHGGTLSCGDDCRFDQESCRTFGRCGDGIIQGIYGEQCEGTELGGKCCQSLGYHGGNLICRNDCTFDLSDCIATGSCGDGIIQEEFGEQCEGTNLNRVSCEELGHHGGTLACDLNCHFDTGACLRFGDGILQPEHGETCDGNDTGEHTCVTLGLYPGVLTCNQDCSTLDTGGCGGFCGDGIVQGDFGETCEPSVHIPYSCGTVGQGIGRVNCTVSCGLDTEGCALAVSVAGGASFSCAVIDDGQVYCWGANQFGQLGDGTVTSRSFSKPVTGLDSVTYMGSGISNHACAVVQGGQVRCWGLNNYGQLGNNSIADSTTPVAVHSLPDAVSVQTGRYFTCALRANGQIACWGENIHGQLGNNSTVASSVPIAVSGISTAVSLAVGYEFACAVLDDNTARCWGKNAFGQLGNGTTTTSLTPVNVTGLNGAAWLFAGHEHACAVLTTGGMYCWGRNDFGQLGIGTVTDSHVPEMVPGMSGVTAASGGHNHTCAVSLGTALCWGANAQGQLELGDTVNRQSPATLPGITDVTGIVAGVSHSCLGLADGRVRCTGQNQHGQLGDGTLDPRSTAVFVQ